MSKMEILIAGHGGQGVLLLGDYLAYTAMLQGKHVACTPSYGPETRGGRTKCYVIISDEVIDNPIVEEPDVEIIMNQQSMEFLRYLRPNGLILYNESLIGADIGRTDVRILKLPATEIAEGLKNELPASDKLDSQMFANAVMYGAFLEKCMHGVTEEYLQETLKHFLEGKKASLTFLNHSAIEKGRQYVRAGMSQEDLREATTASNPSPLM